MSEVPVIRSTQWFRKIECPSAIAGRVSAFARGMPNRSEWLVKLLRKLRPAITASQRSIRRGLGVPVSRDVIVKAGFWRREKFYLSLPAEPALPLPRSQFAQRCVPEGWVRTRVRRLSPGDDECSSLVVQEMARLTWERAPLPPSEVSCTLWEECRRFTSSYENYLSWVKLNAHILGLSVRKAVETCQSSSDRVRSFLSAGRPILVWRPEAEVSAHPGLGW